MNDAMTAEFDTVAGWTAEVAGDLGPDYRIPAGCRGSASPGALRWLIDRLAVRPGDRFLDCGAGVGGPAAFAAEEAGVRPFLSEPEPQACRAAARLFGLPVVQANDRLPFATAAFDAVWCLGVVCTVADQPGLVAELARVVRPEGRVGLLVFTRQVAHLSEHPEGNQFPDDRTLVELLQAADLHRVASADLAQFAAMPTRWREQTDEVEAALEARHGDDPGWRTAQGQSAIMGRLLGGGELVGRLVVASPTAPAPLSP